MVVRKRVRRLRGYGERAGAVALGLAVTAGLAGCSAAADATTAPGPGPASGGASRGVAASAVTVDGDAAREAVRGVPDALVRAGTAKAETSMEMAAGGTRLAIKGAGRYDFRVKKGELRVVLPEEGSADGRPKPITELFTPGALYMKNRGAGVPADKWVRIDTGTAEDGNLVTGGATDPAAAAELLRGARAVTYIGQAKVAGVPVRHYRGTTHIGDAARTASPQVRGALAAAAKGFATHAVPFDAYLDDAGRLRKVRHRFSYANEGREVDVASTTVLYGFGAPVDVQLPPRKDIYTGTVQG